MKQCEQCGRTFQENFCPYCRDDGAEKRPRHLLLLRGQPPTQEPQQIHLVRQLKLPTLEGLLGAKPATMDNLPGRVHALDDAIQAGNLGQADDLMDEIIGSLMQGPGSQQGRRRWGLVGILIWIWVACLGLFFILRYVGA